jgi:hypothetical protein
VLTSTFLSLTCSSVSAPFSVPSLPPHSPLKLLVPPGTLGPQLRVVYLQLLTRLHAVVERRSLKLLLHLSIRWALSVSPQITLQTVWS